MEQKALIEECMQLLANAYHDKDCNVHHGMLNGVRARLVMLAESMDINLTHKGLSGIKPTQTASYKKQD